MHVGILTITLAIDSANSLKDKRQVLKSLIQTVRQRFNVSAAEVGEQDTWRRAVIGASCVSGDRATANSVLDTVVKYVESDPRVEILDTELEFV
jgi:uncharacterized protein